VDLEKTAGISGRNLFFPREDLISCTEEILMPLLSIASSPEGNAYGVPLPFNPMPLQAGSALDEDISLYRRLCKQVGVPPSSSMLLLTENRQVEKLFLRRAGTPEDWHCFLSVFFYQYPRLLARMVAARAAVTVIPSGYRGRSIPSVPEIAIGLGLLQAIGPDVTMIRNEPLPTLTRRRCDYSLYDRGGRCLVRIEIAGMLDRQGRPRTLDGYRYAARQPDRIHAYKLASLAPPVIVHAGELFGVGRRRRIIARILTAAAG
jgi:hypothetical protein